MRDARQGRVEFRLDRSAIIHVPIGKISFDEEKLLENLAAIVETIVKAQPAGAKGQFITEHDADDDDGPGHQAGAGLDARSEHNVENAVAGLRRQPRRN